AFSDAGRFIGLIYYASSPLRPIRTPDDLLPIAAAQGGELPAQAARLDLEERERILEARERVVAEAAEGHAVRSGLQLRYRKGRGEELSTVTGRADPRGGVHRDADVARVAQRRLAAVDPHTHADLLVARPLARLEAALDLDRGHKCARRVGKRREELVGARVDLVAVRASYAPSDQTAHV